MNSISIDIESFSSVDLKKCGLYRYIESPDFEILLFGYSVDGGEVQVVDIANGESVPAHILTALTDNRVVKWAFNAQFERICLSRYLRMSEALKCGYTFHRTPSKLSQSGAWKCTIVWSAYMGLRSPSWGRLGVGLDKQKLYRGQGNLSNISARLPPDKANGGRTRNPTDVPDRWEASGI